MSPRKPCRPLFVKVLVLATALAVVSPTQAFGFHDPVHTFSNVMNSLRERAEAIRQQINQGTQIGHQVTELRQQLRQINDAITQIQTLMADPLGMQAMLGQNTPQEMSAADIQRAQQDRCPSNGGGNVAQYAISIARDALGASDPVMQKQQQICMQIVHHESQRYNMMVRQYRIMEARADQLRQIGRDGQRSNTPGAADGQSIASDQFLSSFLMDMENAKLATEFHKEMVVALQGQQAWLADSALRGSRPNGLLGMATQSLVQGAALEAALRIDR